MEQDVIIEALKGYIKVKGSQNKAATALGISAATLSNILNGKTESQSVGCFIFKSCLLPFSARCQEYDNQ